MLIMGQVMAHSTMAKGALSNLLAQNSMYQETLLWTDVEFIGLISCLFACPLSYEVFSFY